MILEHSLRSTVPLAYRGAVAVGKYEISPHFLIGEAIDQAAASLLTGKSVRIVRAPWSRARKDRAAR